MKNTIINISKEIFKCHNCILLPSCSIPCFELTPDNYMKFLTNGKCPRCGHVHFNHIIYFPWWFNFKCKKCSNTFCAEFGIHKMHPNHDRKHFCNWYEDENMLFRELGRNQISDKDIRIKDISNKELVKLIDTILHKCVEKRYYDER